MDSVIRYESFGTGIDRIVKSWRKASNATSQSKSRRQTKTTTIIPSPTSSTTPISIHFAITNSLHFTLPAISHASRLISSPACKRISAAVPKVSWSSSTFALAPSVLLQSSAPASSSAAFHHFMTSLPSAYTPLESLLLFQALRSEGVHAVSFNRISEQLQNIPIVRNDPTYDSGRLSPDALRDLYLGLLKDEVKRDLDRPANGDPHVAVNGDSSPGSRKRKAASPNLPTVHDAAQHTHLIPQLVSRLYARYRENVVRGLREHERRYALLTHELGEIEAGKWDERMQRQQTASATQSPQLSSTAHTQTNHTASTDPASAPAPQSTVEQRTAAQSKRLPPVTNDVVNNHDQDRANSPGDGHRATSNTTLSSISSIAPSASHHHIQGQDDAPVPTQQQAQPPSQAATVMYTPSPPVVQQPPYPPPNAHPSQPNNNLNHQIPPNLPRPIASPRPVLPPPTGMQVAPPSTQQASSPGMQTPHVPPHQQFAPQHRVQAVPPQINDRSSRAYTPQATPPAPPTFYPQQQQTPLADHRASYPHQQTPNSAYQSQPSHARGYVLAPFPATPQNPAAVQQQQQQQLQSQPQSQQQQQQQQQQRQRQQPQPQQQQQQRHPAPFAPVQRPPQQSSSLPNAPATAPRRPAQAPWRLVSDIVKALATPPRPGNKPLWKSEHRPASINVSGEAPPRPEIEPMSPTRDRLRSPARSTRSARSREPAAVEAPPSQKPPAHTRSSRRRTNARAGSPHSVVSSIADESMRARTRSQSVSTTAGATATSDDRPGSRNGVKAEPSTPANMLEEAAEAVAVPVVTPVSGPRTRKRRGTLQAQPLTHTKRTLQDSPGAADNEQELASTPPPRSHIIAATRNFAKVSAAVMNDINSHKHASYFANAVRDKDAPGYSEIVMQPQNLKSIRAAITAGTRAANVAASNVDSPTGTPAASGSRLSESSSTVELERSVDLIPPKAIVNGAQLEKELMRMFANAFMFNPGEDGMAMITKEMFQDVEHTLNDWRGTEREAGGDEDEDGKGKRRKL